MMKRSGKPSEVIGRMGMSGSLVTQSNSRSARVIFGEVRSPANSLKTKGVSSTTTRTAQKPTKAD